MSDGSEPAPVTDTGANIAVAVADAAPPAAPVESLVAGDPAPAEAAPAEAPVADPLAAEPGVEPGVEPPSDPEPAEPEPPASPVYEAWKVPDGLTMQEDQISAYNALVGEYGLTQEAGQRLMDFGGELLRKAQEQMSQHQIDVFEETRNGWRKQFETEAGNRRNTMLDDAKTVIRNAVPDNQARQELWNALAYTGAGDHPAVIKMLAAIGKQYRERGAPAPSLPQSKPVSPAQRRYGPRG